MFASTDSIHVCLDLIDYAPDFWTALAWSEASAALIARHDEGSVTDLALYLLATQREWCADYYEGQEGQHYQPAGQKVRLEAIIRRYFGEDDQ